MTKTTSPNTANFSDHMNHIALSLGWGKHYCDPRAVAAGCCGRCEAIGEALYEATLYFENFVVNPDAPHSAQRLDLDVLALDQALAEAEFQRWLVDNARVVSNEPF